MKLKYIETKNREKLGEYYFQKSLSFLTNKEFEKSYEYLKESLDYITCDCGFVSILKKNIISSSIFNDIENGNVNHQQYFFVKGMILSYSDKKEFNYQALDAIEKYLNIENNEYANYIKAKILLNLERKNEAIEYFENALNLSNNSRLNYRVGRYINEKGEKSGIINLFNSFIENSSSSCCLRELNIALKNELNNLNLTIEFTENILVQKFLNENPWTTSFFYKKTFLNQIEDTKNIKLINDFLSFIYFNSDIITGKLNEIDEFYLEEDDNNLNFNSYDEYEEDYGSSFNDEYYNDSLDMDQQSPEFWDSL